MQLRQVLPQTEWKPEKVLQNHHFEFQKKELVKIMCAVEETGRYSVNPSMNAMSNA